MEYEEEGYEVDFDLLEQQEEEMQWQLFIEAVQSI